MFFHYGNYPKTKNWKRKEILHISQGLLLFSLNFHKFLSIIIFHYNPPHIEPKLILQNNFFNILFIILETHKFRDMIVGATSHITFSLIY